MAWRLFDIKQIPKTNYDDNCSQKQTSMKFETEDKLLYQENAVKHVWKM